MAIQNLQVKFSTSGVSEVANSAAKAQKSYTDFLAAAQQAMGAAEKAAAAASGNIDAMAKAEQAREKAVTQANRVIANSYRELQVKSSADIERQKAQAVSAYEAIKRSGVASANDISRAEAALQTRLKSLDAQLQQTEQQAKATGGGFTIMGGAIATFLGGAALQVIGQLQGALGGVAASVIQVGTQAERQQVSFETFFHSAEKAKQLRKDLLTFAAKTPFEVPEVIESAKTLAAKGFGYEEIIPTIKRLGEIAAGADKPLSQLLFVYGQIKDQGRVMGQDLNQLTNAGIAISDIAKALNISNDEVRKFVSSGKFGFAELQKVIKSVTSEGGKFYGLMDKLGDTTAVKLSNVNDVFTKVYSNIYNGISPALGAVLDVINSILTPLADNESLFSAINVQAQAFSALLKENPQIIQSIKEALDAGVQVALQGIADTAKEMIAYLKENPQALKDALNELFAAAKAVWEIFGTVIAIFRELLPILGEVASFIGQNTEAVKLLFEAWLAYTVVTKAIAVFTALQAIVQTLITAYGAIQAVVIGFTAAEEGAAVAGLAAIGPAGWITLAIVAVGALAFKWNDATKAIQGYIAQQKDIPQTGQDGQPVADTSEVGGKVVQTALARNGERFQDGVAAQCANWVRSVLEQAGVKVGVTNKPFDGKPTSAGLASSFFGNDIGKAVTKMELKPGDLVAFGGTYGGYSKDAITHVGIYVGGGMIEDRSTSSAPVRKRSIDTFEGAKLRLSVWDPTLRLRSAKPKS